MTRGKLVSAILLNLFVFPGSGQMLLKRKARGLVIMAILITLLCAMIFHASYLISSLIKDLPFTIDLWTTAKDLNQKLLTRHGFLLKSYFFSLMLVYLYAVADVILVGFKNISKD